MKPLKLGAQIAASPLASINGSLPLWLGAFLCVSCAYLERRLVPSGAVDRALLRDCFGVIFPLTAYALFERACRAGRLDGTVRPIARYGASGRRAMLGASLLLLGVTAAAGTMFAGVTVLAARGLSDPALLADVALSCSVGALAGAAYASWLVLASGVGRRGSGRKWLILLDFVLGSSGGSLAVVWPRGHIRNLLGAEPLFGQTQRTAASLLLVTSVVAVLLALRRAPD
jgi:hypothetical protein